MGPPRVLLIAPVLLRQLLRQYLTALLVTAKTRRHKNMAHSPWQQTGMVNIQTQDKLEEGVEYCLYLHAANQLSVWVKCRPMPQTVDV